MGSVGTETIELDVLIVGAGFSGIYALYMIRKLGLSAKIVEAGSGYGGVWHWNRYPGARVDSEMPTYQLNIPEVYYTWEWSHRYPDHHELRNYFDHTAKVLDLRKDTIFNTVVDGATWDGKKWRISTEAGVQYTCKYFVPCTGFAYKKHYPAVPGLDIFKGVLVHSAEYPANLDLTGKNVGVVGNGASGIQCIQEIAKEDCHLTSFIRTINTAYPMGQRKFDPAEQHVMKSFYSTILQAGRNTPSGYPYNPPPSSLFNERSPEENAKLLEDTWKRGGFTFNLSTTQEFSYDKEVNKAMYEFWTKKSRARMTDPIKREIVAPSTQPYWIGTKRPSLEQHYYESIDRPNVDVVDLKKTPIQEVTADGIITADGSFHPLDVLLLATGYDFWTGGLTDMNIRDKNGMNLKEKWASACETHLGLTIPDCPNLFFVFGPQSPAALGNTLPIVEFQVEWICLCLQRMKSSGIETIEAQCEPAKKWRETIQQQCAYTLYSEGNNYYVGANIPGKPREQLPWMGGVNQYIKKCNEAFENLDGFNLTYVDKAQALSA